MNKLICIVLSCVIFVFVFTGCKEKQNVESQNESVPSSTPQEETNLEEEKIPDTPIYKEYDTNISFEEMFSEVYEETHLSGDNAMSEEDAREFYNIVDIEDVDFEVRKSEDYEIAIFKLKNTSQSITMLERISSRIQKENRPEDKICIQQNRGVITVVIGDDSRSICDKIAKLIKEK